MKQQLKHRAWGGFIPSKIKNDLFLPRLKMINATPSLTLRGHPFLICKPRMGENIMRTMISDVTFPYRYTNAL
jgi:hypothetical protein